MFYNKKLFFFSSQDENIEKLSGWVEIFKQKLEEVSSGKMVVKSINGNKNNVLKKEILKKIKNYSRVDNYLDFPKFYESLKKYKEFSSIGGKIIILDSSIAGTKGGSVFGSPGISSPDNRVAFFSVPDESIAVHELAHLFGADDHYELNPPKPKAKCCDKKNCLMLYQTNKHYLFCGQAKKEVYDHCVDILKGNIRYYLDILEAIDANNEVIKEISNDVCRDLDLIGGFYKNKLYKLQYKNGKIDISRIVD